MIRKIYKEHYFEYGEKELRHLQERDDVLGAAIRRIGMIQRKVNPNTFSSLMESIVSQQISSKAAATVCQKLGKLCGADSLIADRIHALNIEEIQSCGMSMRKAGYIKNIAEAAITGAIDFEALPTKSDAEIIKMLTAIKGIGLWTVEMLLIFSLKRPDVVSYGDLAIRRSMMNLYEIENLTREQFLQHTKQYSPYGSIASFYLWELSVRPKNDIGE